MCFGELILVLRFGEKGTSLVGEDSVALPMMLVYTFWICLEALCLDSFDLKAIDLLGDLISWYLCEPFSAIIYEMNNGDRSICLQQRENMKGNCKWCMTSSLRRTGGSR